MNRAPNVPQDLMRAEQIVHLIKLYFNGVLGPSAMWMGIAGELSPENAVATLNALPPDKQQELRALYFGIPPHAYIAREPLVPEEEAFQTVCVKVVEWCEAGAKAFQPPDMNDGLVRVVIRDGRVRRAPSS